MNPCTLFKGRLVIEASKYIFRDIQKRNDHLSLGRIFCLNEQSSLARFNLSEPIAMSQRSITSFFCRTAKVSLPISPAEKEVKEDGGAKPPVTNGKEKRSSKRARLDSSGSDAEAVKSPHTSPTPSPDQKKKPKRQRIESSDSECEPAERASPTCDVKSSPQPAPSSPGVTSSPTSAPSSPVKSSPTPVPSSPVKSPKVKVESTASPKTYSSPKSNKGRQKALKEANKSSQKVKVTSEKSPKISKVKTEVVGADVKENIKVELESPDDDSSQVVPVPETEYAPGAAGYHPVAGACWARGRPVPYLALAATLHAIEHTSARLKIVNTLSNYFRSVIALTPEDLVPSVYLCLNQLAPAYHSLELGIAETYLMKAVGACTGRSLAQLRADARRGGDLGAAAEAARAAQRTMFPQPPLTLRKVFASLKEIANMTGQASVNKKIAKIQSLYVASRHYEARYLIRSLEGKLRIGLAEQSVLQALALATATTPPDPQGVKVLDASKGISPEKFKARVDEHALIIKRTYCECPNYEALIPVVLEHGVAALPQYCRLTVGVPLKPMLAHPTKGVHEVFNRFEGEEFTCEWKYDGERAQIHVPAGGGEGGTEGGAGGGAEGGGGVPDFARAAVFSRNQENNTSKYPDIVRRLPSLLKESVSDCVLDCEAVAYDTVNKQILPFQILSTRKRKDASEADIKVQVCVFLFDLLYLNGRALVREPLAARRQLLRDNFNQVPGEWQFATSKDCGDMEEVQGFLEEAVRGSCEGLMVKALRGDNATYDIARRSHNWLKLKKDYLEGVGDTVDVVIIGAYFGRGKRRHVYGGFLAACREPAADCYQALCRLGTGFSDDDLVSFTESLDRHRIPQPRSYYLYDKSHGADAWFEARCVWEVRCADLSLSPAHRAAIGLVDPDKGISLRFPRFVRVREDKSPEQATSAQQIARMYLAQDQVRNTAARPTYNDDDFY